MANKFSFAVDVAGNRIEDPLAEKKPANVKEGKNGPKITGYGIHPQNLEDLIGAIRKEVIARKNESEYTDWGLYQEIDSLCRRIQNILPSIQNRKPSGTGN